MQIRFNIIMLSYCKGHAMAQVVSHWPLNVEAGFTPGSVNVGFVVDKMTLEQVFLQVLQFSLVSIVTLHIYISFGR
jgi:hypothetical protein